MTLEELLKQLKELKCKRELFGKIEDFNVINKSEFSRVENLIRQFALDNHDEQLGLLQAKVYAYEQIIANSNFAPMIIKKNKEDKGLERQVYGKVSWEDVKNGKPLPPI